MSKGTDRKGDGVSPAETTRLTPSDQLLAIFAVNLLLLAWVGFSFSRFHRPDAPELEGWIYLAEVAILVLSLSLSLFDAWWRG
jgi:hypothetical protein